MFRNHDNQSIAGTPTVASSSSSHESTTSSSYPPLDEKHKKESLRKDEKNDLVFQDEPDSNGASEGDQRFIKKLSEQAYHLPGYAYWDDWKQYITK